MGKWPKPASAACPVVIPSCSSGLRASRRADVLVPPVRCTELMSGMYSGGIPPGGVVVVVGPAGFGAPATGATVVEGAGATVVVGNSWFRSPLIRSRVVVVVGG